MIVTLDCEHNLLIIKKLKSRQPLAIDLTSPNSIWTESRILISGSILKDLDLESGIANKCIIFAELS
jgi:hypothetical protein